MTTKISQVTDVAEDNLPTSRFFTMPPELRNNIYELVFEAPTGEIDLLKATPPSKSLLLACRQIYEEAKGLYRTAYKGFWSDSRFVFHAQMKALEHPVGFSEQDLTHVRHLACFFPLQAILNILGLGHLAHLRQNPLLGFERLASVQWKCVSADGQACAPGFRFTVTMKADSSYLSYIAPSVWRGLDHREGFRTITKEEMGALVGFPLKMKEGRAA